MAEEDLGWLDIHGHFYMPAKNAEEVRKVTKAFQDVCFMCPDDWQWSIQDSLNYMDEAGVQMQMLSYLPKDLDALKAANDFSASQVKAHPARLGHLCALPTDDPHACLQEIKRATGELQSDGFAVTACRKGVYLSDPSLDPVWSRLNELGATVFSHPDASAPGSHGRPAALIEVAFETCRTIVDMVYKRLFQRFPNIKFVFAHSGGVLPMLAGRVELLGPEPWVPNPENITAEDIRSMFASIYVDTAATASTGMEVAMKMVGKDHIVYGADCGVPCSTSKTMNQNKAAVTEIEEKLGMVGSVGLNGWKLFPSCAKRVRLATYKNGTS